jgi:hypothetical protein
VAGTKLAVLAIVRACFQCQAWSALNENVLLLSKRRAQLKQARVCCAQPLPLQCFTELTHTCAHALGWSRSSQPWSRSA